MNSTSLAGLLEKRKRIKQRKPEFVVHDSKVKARIRAHWRKPRGRHSAVRERNRGRQKMVTSGYGSPAAVRGLHSSGLERVLVATEKDLQQITPTQQGVIIAHTVGNKKRVQLIQLATQKGIAILNFREPQKTREHIQQQLQERKKKQTVKLSKKEQQAKEQAQKEEQAKVPSPSAAEPAEEKGAEPQEKERKEVEKTLIKRQ